MLRSAATANVQTIAATLIVVINSLPSGGECVQLYRMVRHVQSAVNACVDWSFQKLLGWYPLRPFDKLRKAGRIRHVEPIRKGLAGKL